MKIVGRDGKRFKVRLDSGGIIFMDEPPVENGIPYFPEPCWDARFLDLARTVSTWSKDPSTKVGAVIVDDKRRVVSLGYNGYARGVDDVKLTDREFKYPRTVHAEVNAILFGKDVEGCTLYTYPFPPCLRCASIVIQSGIRRVVAVEKIPDRWAEEMGQAVELLKEGGVEYAAY